MDLAKTPTRDEALMNREHFLLVHRLDEDDPIQRAILNNLQAGYIVYYLDTDEIHLTELGAARNCQ